MFSKDTYISRRQELKKLVKKRCNYTLRKTTTHLAISQTTDITHSDRTLLSCTISDSRETDW